MNKLIYIVIIGVLIIFVGILKIKRTQNMSENSKLLKEVRSLIDEFEKEKEPERLREAFLILERLDLAQESNQVKSRRVRAECLIEWLTMINLLDQNLDPGFNPNDQLETRIQPPRTSSGVLYPPGTDPKFIDDPKARAEYEKAIALNREKLEKYRIQVQLIRLNEVIPSEAIIFIQSSFTSSYADKAEVKLAIEENIKNPNRKEELTKQLSLSEEQ